MPDGSFSDPVLAAAVAVSASSPTALKESSRPREQVYEVAVDPPVVKSTQARVGEPMPKITLMPRAVVIGVIGIVIVVLAFGLLFGG
jgi:hypothetical protein